MTYSSLKSKLQTAATAGSITTLVFGYLDEVNILRTDTRWPVVCIIPPNKPLKVRSEPVEFITVDVEMYIIDEWSRDWDATQREATWDAIDGKAQLFFRSFDTQSGVVLMNPDNVQSQPIINGIINEEVIAVKYDFKVKLYC